MSEPASRVVADSSNQAETGNVLDYRTYVEVAPSALLGNADMLNQLNERLIYLRGGLSTIIPSQHILVR